MADFIYVPTSKLPDAPNPALVNTDYVQGVIPLGWASGGLGSRIFLNRTHIDCAWSVEEVGEALAGNLVLVF